MGSRSLFLRRSQGDPFDLMIKFSVPKFNFNPCFHFLAWTSLAKSSLIYNVDWILKASRRRIEKCPRKSVEQGGLPCAILAVYDKNVAISMWKENLWGFSIELSKIL